MVCSVIFLGACSSVTQKRSLASAGSLDDSDNVDPAVVAGIEKDFKGVMDSRNQGKKTFLRAVFLKLHGCAQAKFEVLQDTPQDWRQGFFATPGVHDAWVRISSDTDPTTPDGDDNTVGFAIKVLGVPGEKILKQEPSADTQDFLLQNHSVFFVDTAQDMLEMTDASLSGKFDDYASKHPTTGRILDEMAHDVEDVFATNYYTPTPYHFGATEYAKYRVTPCGSSDPNFLQQRMEQDLAGNRGPSICFEFQVQLRKANPWPANAATVRWDAKSAPFQTVAKLTLQKQDVHDNDPTCEALAFNSYHSLPFHKPAGSINTARGIIYQDLSMYRRQHNGVSTKEP